MTHGQINPPNVTADISTRFLQLSTSLGTAAAAAREIKFPINTFIRIASGLPVRAGSKELAKRCLADYDAANVPVAPLPMALSSLPPAGETGAL